MTATLQEIVHADQDLLLVPKMKGRALIAFGNEAYAGEQGIVTSHGGTNITGPAQCQSIGFQDETHGHSAAIGLNHSGAIFDRSGSAGGNADFLFFYEDLTSAIWYRHTLVSYNCGSVSIDASSPPGPPVYSGLMIISGRTMSVKSGYVTPSGTGDQSFTGLGFKPGLMIFTCFGQTFFGDSGPPVVGKWAMMSIGAADNKGNQWAMNTTGGVYGVDGSASRTHSASTSSVVTSRLLSPVSHVSMNTDGFTLNWSGPTLNDRIIQYWAIADPDGDFTVGTCLDGTSSIPTGFSPDMIFFANSASTALNSDQPNCVAIGVGACDSSLNQLSGWAAAGTYSAKQAHYWNDTATSMTLAPADPLLNGVWEGTVTAFNSASVSLSWLNPSNTNIIGWAALKTSKGPGWEGCGRNLGQIYRILEY